eukprot:12081615-Ditylum_brightwellii.AAC.2
MTGRFLSPPSWSLSTLRRRVLLRASASAILARTKLHISKYSLCQATANKEAILFSTASASSVGMPSAEYTIEVKVYLRSRQASKYFFFFCRSASFSTASGQHFR